MSRYDDLTGLNPAASFSSGGPSIRVPRIGDLFPGLKEHQVTSSLTNYQSVLQYMTADTAEAMSVSVSTAPFRPVSQSGDIAATLTEHYRSDAGNVSFTFDHGAMRRVGFTPDSRMVAAAIDGVIQESTDGTAGTLAQFAPMLRDHLAWVPGGNADRMLAGMQTLRGAWSFDYDSEGTLSRMQVGGRTVSQGDPLWRMGTTLHDAVLSRASADGIISFENPDPVTPDDASEPGETMLASAKAPRRLSRTPNPGA